MKFDLVSAITDIETIAKGRGIRNLAALNREYGRGNWRKLKGMAYVQWADGSVTWEEVHWYEAHGIGRVQIKVKDWNEDE